MSSNTRNKEYTAGLLLIGILLFSGCNRHERKQDEHIFVQDTLKNGLVLVKGVMINNKKEGLWNEYNNDGTLMSAKCYINDTLNGRYIFYGEYGWVFSVGQYKDNFKEGEWFSYYEYPNSIATKEHYSKGKKVGEWEDYDEHGNIRLRVRYGSNEEEEILEDNRIPPPK